MDDSVPDTVAEAEPEGDPDPLVVGVPLGVIIAVALPEGDALPDTVALWVTVPLEEPDDVGETDALPLPLALFEAVGVTLPVAETVMVPLAD